MGRRPRPDHATAEDFRLKGDPPRNGTPGRTLKKNYAIAPPIERRKDYITMKKICLAVLGTLLFGKALPLLAVMLLIVGLVLIIRAAIREGRQF